MWILGLKGLTKFTKTTVKPPLTVGSLQQPLYFVPADKKTNTLGPFIRGTIRHVLHKTHLKLIRRELSV